MAAPGDPQTPSRGQADDHDDLIGFTSPSSLAGAERRPAPSLVEPSPVEPAPVEPAPIEVEPVEEEPAGADLFDDFDPRLVAAKGAVALDSEPGPEPQPQPEPETASDDLGPLFSTPSQPASPEPVSSEPAPVATPPVPQVAANMDFDAPPTPTPAPTPSRPAQDWTREPTPAPTFGKARRAEPPEGAMGLYAVYALILFAVPTLGVSALLALLAVTGRPGPDQPLAHSHFLFQQRTLWIAAVTAVLGVVLIAVNLGVFVLVIMALWVLIRGAAGVIRLASGQAIDNPKTWLI
ncbi:hypothetical protein BH09PSE1_BH09PSE1_03870 [soil metagenome]